LAGTWHPFFAVAGWPLLSRLHLTLRLLAELTGSGLGFVRFTLCPFDPLPRPLTVPLLLVGLAGGFAFALGRVVSLTFRFFLVGRAFLGGRKLADFRLP
jgi:hypothetical protein